MMFTDELIGSLLRTALAAGEAILKVYSRDFDVESKADDSPLTEADRAAHGIIAEALARTPVEGEILPLISEEGEQPAPDQRRSWERYWLIDPLDGTKEFVKKSGEFTVNIALILRERNANGEFQWYPALGVVYAPVLDEAFVGWNAGLRGADPDALVAGADAPGAFRISGLSAAELSVTEAGPQAWRSSARRIRSASLFPDEGESLRVVASRSHLNDATREFIHRLEATGRRIETANSGSSLKLCRVATGEAQAYPRFAPTCEWDTAAADAVCRGAGARVLSAETGNLLVYNKEDILNPHFLVTGIREIQDLLGELIEEQPEEQPEEHPEEAQ
jgi:3'(2'), 5'-bisphosphate nucleotidase